MKTTLTSCKRNYWKEIKPLFMNLGRASSLLSIYSCQIACNGHPVIYTTIHKTETNINLTKNIISGMKSENMTTKLSLCRTLEEEKRKKSR